MSEHLRQQLIEITQTANAYHAEVVTELRAEIKRLRTNITEAAEYARGRADGYQARAEVGGTMAGYYQGKADAYADMSVQAIIAYGKPSEQAPKQPNTPKYGSAEFPYVYHEDHIDGRTLVPESVARNYIGRGR